MKDSDLWAEGPPIKYDNTMAVTFEQCRRKFYWWRRGFDYSGRPSYFAFGSAWGVFQGLWHDSIGPHILAGESGWQEALDNALAGALLFWDKQGTEDFKVNSRENLVKLALLYTETYQLEPWKMVKGGAERGFLWPLEGTTYFLGGATDGQLYWEDLEKNLFKEDKTTGIYLNDAYIRQWAFSSQITQYCWYGTRLYGEEKFHGLLVDMASKKITKAGKTPQFGRVLETRSEDQLKEFEEDWKHLIYRIEDTWEKWHWPKTRDTINCTGGIGKAPCLYQKLCLSDMDFRELNPLQFDSITLRLEEWQPWNWTDPLKEITKTGGKGAKEVEDETSKDTI